MKKLLFTFLLAILACGVQAQISGKFLGLTMGFSSMEDAIEVLEDAGIDYEADYSDSSISFENHTVELEGYAATMGYMLFMNDQLVMAMVGVKCDDATGNCKNIKRGLKTKYIDLEDDYNNYLLQAILTEADTKWVKKDNRMNVFYASADGELIWGYAMSLDKMIQSIFGAFEGTLNYLDMLNNLLDF